MSSAVTTRWDRASFVRLGISALCMGAYIPLRIAAGGSEPGLLPLLVLILGVTSGGFQANAALKQMSPRDAREAHRSGRWPLGRGYLMGTAEGSDAELRGSGRLRFTEEHLEHGTVRVRVVLLSAITTIRVKPSWIEVEADGRRTRLVPQSFADRERLLFEFAVRCPEAIDRGLDELPAPPPSPAKPVAPAQELVARPAPSGLASALAGPMTTSNPAPPRKSGLGVGLFPPGT